MIALPMWKELRQPLSFKQICGATAAVLLAAGTIYGAYRCVTALWHRQKLERTIPAALAGVRAQREVLVGIIEEYKARFGYYPPMSTPPGPSRGIVNPLAYPRFITMLHSASSFD